MADFLTRALGMANGKTALVKHRDACDVCSDTYDCVVAKAHLRSIAQFEEKTDG